MSKYKVLWIDDKWEEMISFKEVCELPENDFEMICTTNAEDGMRIFENHLEEWSGVILDAKVFLSSTSEVDRLKGMRYSINKINEFKTKNDVPYYIFTGQPDLISSSYFAEEHEGHYYEKDRDEDKLIADIKRKADLLPSTKIIHKYQSVFDLWPESKHDLLRILTALENEEWQNNSILNDIRKIMDDVVIRMCQCGICTVQHNGTNLSECSKMLCLRHMSEIIPTYIQKAISSCVGITNEGSHRTQTDKHIKTNKAPYLIRSLIYNMLDILYWCKNLPDPKNRNMTVAAIEKAKEKYLSKGYYNLNNKQL